MMAAVGQPFGVGVREVGYVAFDTLVWLSLPLLALALFLGVRVEFLQVGPIVTGKKLPPSLDKLNPVEGIKKMFSMDNLVELVKSVVKSAALIFIVAYVLWCMLQQLLLLPFSPQAPFRSAVWYAMLRFGSCLFFVFFFFLLFDS